MKKTGSNPGSSGAVGAASSLLLHLLPDQGVKRPLGDLFVTSKKLTNILSQSQHPFIISPDIQTSA